jgi:hypothetical protein
MKAPKMKKTPSALKWLAEKRARVAGELQSCEQTMALLEEDIQELRKRLTFIEVALANASVRRARLTAELGSMDRVVQMYDESIDPAAIAPINGWQGNYGKRGALRKFLIETLRSRASEFISTSELELLTVIQFSLVFEHLSLRRHWYNGSFRGSLKLLVSQGYVERSHKTDTYTREIGSWRWKQAQPPTLEDLREQGD